jgi:hypothetical protein
MSDKIQPTHLEREAYVYVRQSSMSQVRNHLESQDRQYGLAEKANVLGFKSVTVIDEDLGRSEPVQSSDRDSENFSRLSAPESWAPCWLWMHPAWLGTIETGIILSTCVP